MIHPVSYPKYWIVPELYSQWCINSQIIGDYSTRYSRSLGEKGQLVARTGSIYVMIVYMDHWDWLVC